MEKESVKRETGKKDMVVKEKNFPVAAQSFAEGGWDQEALDATDVLIPNLLLMHPTSDLVKKGEKVQGDIIRSTNGEVLAKRNEAVEIIVFEKWKDWRIMKKNPQSARYEYVRKDAWTAENDQAPWDYTEDGEAFRRDKTLHFYGLLVKDINENRAFPVRLSFVRTSYKAGLKIADAYERAIMEKQAPIRMSFKIGTELVMGKNESFFAFTVAYENETSQEQMRECLKWRKLVTQAKRNNKLKDHEEEESSPMVESSTQTEF
jgi:hypothetical protein